MSEAWEKVKLLPIQRRGSSQRIPGSIVMRALKKVRFKMAPTGNGVGFELHSHRIVLLLFFLLDTAKTSPQTQN